MNTIIRISLFAIIWIGLASMANPVFAQSTQDDFTEVDAYIAETMHRFSIKGLALAIVKGGEILYMHGYGTANAQGDPATPQTPWPMASVTKSFTALAIQQLALAGKVDLYAPLQTYLPEFRLADEQSAATITVRDLLDHKSGISTVEGDQPYLYSSQITFEEALQRLARYQPTYKPGGHYEYSNWNYILLGQIIAHASGQPYAEYMQKNILTPLEMSDSTFADYHTLPHAATGNLIVYGIQVPYDEKFIPVRLSAGYLTATAEDMAHYLSLFFSLGQYHGHSLLPARAQGWYDPWWNWQNGRPTSDLVLGFSGGYNSISTSCLLFPRQETGVVLLLNTRLDELSPAITSYDIALGIGKIITNQPYQPPSNTDFYSAWALVDAFLLLFIVSILWQAARLKTWRNQYQAARRSKRALAWLVAVFDLLICLGLLAFPPLVNTTWRILIYQRPDFAFPVLVIAICLGALGFIKVGLGIIVRNKPELSAS